MERLKYYFNYFRVSRYVINEDWLVLKQGVAWSI